MKRNPGGNPDRGDDPIAAVIFDWAGTVVDHGCMAPVAALRNTLGEAGIAVTDEDARAHMGLPKLLHLRALLESPAVAERWRTVRGRAPDESEILDLYARLEREIFACLAEHSGLIEGAAGLAAWLVDKRIRIGSTTGYTARMMEVVAPLAAAGGFRPEAIVTPDDVPDGRPSPLMIYANAIRLGAWPLWRVVKIGDTPSDMAEGRNAGCWTIGVALTGNALGLASLSGANSSGVGPEAARVERARRALAEAGADCVVDGVASAIPALEEIGRRIRAGERPV